MNVMRHDDARMAEHRPDRGEYDRVDPGTVVITHHGGHNLACSEDRELLGCMAVEEWAWRKGRR